MSRFTENTPPAVAKGKMPPKQGVTAQSLHTGSLPHPRSNAKPISWVSRRIGVGKTSRSNRESEQ